MKITKTEFEKWNEEFKRFLDNTIEVGVRNNTLTAQDINQIISVGALLNTHLKMGNYWAVMAGLDLIKGGCVPENERSKTFAEIGGRVFNEWENEIKQKLRDHCIAGGYYDPNKPMDLTALHQREKNIKGWSRNLDYKTKLLSHADPENREYLLNLALFFEEATRIFPQEDERDDEPQKIEKDKEWYFIFEDQVARVEKAKKALEEFERNHLPLPPPQNPNNNSPSQNQESNNSKGGKVYWIIFGSLGMAAVILICLVLLTKKKKNIIKITLLILGVILCGIGVFWIGKKFGQSSTNPETPPTYLEQKTSYLWKHQLYPQKN